MLSFLRTVRSVLWAFFGVRRGRGYDADIAHNKPAPSSPPDCCSRPAW